MWRCSYCGGYSTITGSNRTINRVPFNNGNKHGEVTFAWTATSCPNPACKEITLTAAFYKIAPGPEGNKAVGVPLHRWSLLPESSARPLPAYVPAVIVEDYIESCRIRDLSPKASATLSRRCLQGMIRDFWKIARNRLIDEIRELEDKVDSSTWKAIDAVRSIGNIGAHMEKDIDVIVDVGPGEAQALLELIELLIDDWYIARHDRNERLAAITRMAAEKAAMRKGQVDPEQGV